MKPGDKVVCIDDSPCNCGCNRAMGIREGTVYVIESFNACALLAKEPVITLIGVEDWSDETHGRGYYISRFRLLDELKQEARERNKNTQPKQKDQIV